eukprot:scaffold5063_cov187-Alexandrium_tamarense.AAC.1
MFPSSLVLSKPLCKEWLREVGHRIPFLFSVLQRSTDRRQNTDRRDDLRLGIRIQLLPVITTILFQQYSCMQF